MKTTVKTILCAGMITLFGVSGMQAKKQALLIGISDYGHDSNNPQTWTNINGANDISLLQPALEKQGFTINTLTDAAATYAAITGALNGLAETSNPGDILYVHFSTHGQPVEDLNGDEDDGWDEAIIPVDALQKYEEGVYEGANHLIDDELEVYFNNIREKLGPTGQLYVVMDACHSGTSLRDLDDDEAPVRGTRSAFSRTGEYYRPVRTKDTNDYFTLGKTPTQSPITVLEACRAYEVNREILNPDTKEYCGPLSYYISKALENHQIGTSEEWVENVKYEMSQNKKLKNQNLVIEKSE